LDELANYDVGNDRRGIADFKLETGKNIAEPQYFDYHAQGNET
jgi:hypothetical protein